MNGLLADSLNNDYKKKEIQIILKKVYLLLFLLMTLFISACGNQILEVPAVSTSPTTISTKPVSTVAPTVKPSIPTEKPTASAAPVATPTSVQTEPDEYDYELIFPSDKYPETALHILGAIEQGYTDVCTIDRDGAEDNRKESLKGIDTRVGYDRDEWPMAMCEEGGKGASVAYIDPSDNRGAGSWVGNQLDDYPNGTKILFIVEKPKNLFPVQTKKPTKAPAATKEPTKAPTAKPSSKPSEKPTTKPTVKPTTKPTPAPTKEPAVDVYYKNCTAAREAGAAPVYNGDPGYAKHLDRDGDGVACE